MFSSAVRRRALALCVLVIGAAPGAALVHAAPATVPGPPTVMAISSLGKSATVFDLRVTFSAPGSTGGARIVSVVVSAGGRTCTSTKATGSCVIRNLRKNASVKVSAKARNSRGWGRPSGSIRYVVGSRNWTRAPSATTTTTTSTTVAPVRPFDVQVPAGYDSNVPAPLVVLLHGYGWRGKQLSDFTGLTNAASRRGLLLVAPDGTVDPTGAPFWNATDACCDLFSSGVDDDAYLMSIVGSVQKTYSVDAKRIYFMGHSNGGFMSYRMACNHSDRVAAIASLAGAMPIDQAKCPATNPVSVLQIHGTNDERILYNGGVAAYQYPGATTSVGRWVQTNQCNTNPATSTAVLDLDSSLAGNETNTSVWSSCKGGSEVALWTMINGTHTPNISSGFIDSVLDFLLAHPKP